ncbi:MAG TPA: hypothetical protein VN519_13410 [Bryobacteraceae bacterium]|nr:hypothetical protein [Bryobacteraceae bacterium]
MTDQKRHFLWIKPVSWIKSVVYLPGNTLTFGRGILFPVIAGLAVLSSVGVPDLRAATGSAVTGSVTDDAGNPVRDAGVLVSYAADGNGPRLPAPPVVTGRLVATALTDSQGSFAISTLSPGRYVACVEVTAPGLLDPCHWATSAPTFTVTTEQTAASVKIVMTRGAVLSIHVSDSKGLLTNSVAGPVDFDFQVHIVTGKGMHYNAPIQNHTAVGRDYVATIPYDTPVNVRVLAAKVSVVDQVGKALPTSGPTIAIPAGITPALISFSVTEASVVTGPAGANGVTAGGLYNK